jgi:hypothetical protein
MNKIVEMIESSPTKKDAIDMLNSWRIFGNVTEVEFAKGRELINEEFGFLK